MVKYFVKGRRDVFAGESYVGILDFCPFFLYDDHLVMLKQIPQKTFLGLPKNKRQKIVEIATQEFATKGYTKASLNRIVEKLGIAKGSIYQYFHNKEHLFLYVFSHGVQLAKQVLKPIRDQKGDIFEKLAASLKMGILFVQQHPYIYQIYLKILFEEQVPGRKHLVKALRFYSRDYLLPILKEAQAKGEVRRELDLEMTAFMLDAIMERFLQAYALSYLDTIDIHKAKVEDIEDKISTWLDILKIGLSDGRMDERNRA